MAATVRALLLDRQRLRTVEKDRTRLTEIITQNVYYNTLHSFIKHNFKNTKDNQIQISKNK